MIKNIHLHEFINKFQERSNRGFRKKDENQGFKRDSRVLAPAKETNIDAIREDLVLGRNAVIEALNRQDRPIVYLLWGTPAGRKKVMLNNPKHLILTAPHPSPLSAYRGFFGCKHFSATNNFLVSRGLTPIDWQIENV